MNDPVALIHKHKSRGVLLDANLLVLYLIGLTNRRRIPLWKRTRAFLPKDFDLLDTILRFFGKVVVTPHVLSQASDLSDLQGEELFIVRGLFKEAVEKYFEEIFDPSKALVADPVFARLGLADAGIAAVSSRGTLVLTADWDLHGALESRGLDSLHFDVIRTISTLFNAT